MPATYSVESQLMNVIVLLARQIIQTSASVLRAEASCLGILQSLIQYYCEDRLGLSYPASYRDARKLFSEIQRQHPALFSVILDSGREVVQYLRFNERSNRHRGDIWVDITQLLFRDISRASMIPPSEVEGLSDTWKRIILLTSFLDVGHVEFPSILHGRTLTLPLLNALPNDSLLATFEAARFGLLEAVQGVKDVAFRMCCGNRGLPVPRIRRKLLYDTLRLMAMSGSSATNPIEGVRHLAHSQLVSRILDIVVDSGGVDNTAIEQLYIQHLGQLVPSPILVAQADFQIFQSLCSLPEYAQLSDKHSPLLRTLISVLLSLRNVVQIATSLDISTLDDGAIFFLLATERSVLAELSPCLCDHGVLETSINLEDLQRVMMAIESAYEVVRKDPFPPSLSQSVNICQSVEDIREMIVRRRRDL